VNQATFRANKLKSVSAFALSSFLAACTLDRIWWVLAFLQFRTGSNPTSLKPISECRNHCIHDELPCTDILATFNRVPTLYAGADSLGNALPWWRAPPPP
jgi:hypothetical protein